MIGGDRLVGGELSEHFQHVVGACVVLERPGGLGELEEALGFAFAARLHVEQAQADAGRDVVRGRLKGEQIRAFGGVVLATVGQALAQGVVEGDGAWVDGQRLGFGLRGADRVDSQAARRRETREGLFTARIEGDGFLRRFESVGEALVGDVAVRFQDQGAAHSGLISKAS